MSLRSILCVGGIGLLAACSAVGPDYSGPGPSAADAVDNYPSTRLAAAGEGVRTLEPTTAWWRQLDDAELDALMNDALSANYDVQIAAANVEAARAIVDEVDTRRLPTVDLNGVVQERRDSSSLLVLADSHNRLPTTSSSTLSVDLAWEVDLFGRVRRSIEAATAELGSLEALHQDVMVAVLAQVARAYVDLRGAQARLDVASNNVVLQQQTLDLVVLLNEEGAATQLDVVRARTQLLTSQATIPALRAAATNAMNRLATLTANAPGALNARLAAHQPLPRMPDFVAVGTPADLLRRRPDIRAAERALAGAAARIGVATADLFPSISFGGRLGVGAAPLSTFVHEGAPFFSLGPALNWNLFNRDAIHARIRQADSNASANLARYQLSVATALAEVDTAINAYLNERERRDQLAAARAASAEATDLARLRYREGVEDFLTVLDAERRLLEVDDQLAVSSIGVAQRLVDIHLALGGGWETAAAAAYTPYAP